MSIRVVAALMFVAACEPKEVIPDRTDTDASTGSECGAPVFGLELDFVGVVVDTEGDPVADATVVLEDRSRPPAIDLGTATTSETGRFRFHASDITDFPGCSLSVWNYTLVAESGARSTERLVNREMYTAFDQGEDTVDLSARPFTLAP